MRVLFTCGGTAGHINPALGVAGRIRELIPEAEILFVGAEGNMETELVPREGYELKTVRIDGFQRSLKPRMVLRNLRTAGWLVESLGRSKKLLREFRPDVAVGTGGYVCYPVLKAAADLGIPTAVHESNAVPGLTTRLLEKKVDRIMVGLEESRQYYKDPDKVELTGTPVRVAFRNEEKRRARRELGLPEEEPVVMAAFGSLGAAYMNDVMQGVLRRMGTEPDFRLIYATGRRYYEEVRAALDREGIRGSRIDVREYIYDMPRVMAAADIVISRSGASTLSELTYLGKPSILVPSPNVVNHHQEKNAKVLADGGAAVMLPEGGLTADGLYDVIRDLLRDTAKLEDMSRAARAMGVPDATDRITSIVLGLAENKPKN